ncbi:MAG: polyhydroxyalkanoate depolymerase [Alphaproteobacteria bacterium]
MLPLLENSYLYSFVDSNRFYLEPLNHLIKQNINWSKTTVNPFSYTEAGHYINAAYELSERLTKEYTKPNFNINHVMIGKKEIPIKEVIVISKPFCKVIHFKKHYTKEMPKLLIVAPMAGHHSTLLKSTVADMLPFFDVYITDWIDAKFIPISEGSFDMDDYINYVIEFFEKLAPNLHVMAVCQPTVPVLAAVSILSEDNSKYIPKSMILMGGPIDTRKSPTAVDDFAIEKSIEWFKSHVITRVPITYPGYMRPVYPGFIQLTGFVSMNFSKHYDSHMNLFKMIIEGDQEGANKIRSFYDEYFSVMDLPAEFYLQTIKQVFQDHELPKGIMISRGRKINPASITKCALFGIEGEKDDISGLGQTKAALTICKNIPQDKKHYYMQKEVGHYGVFSGSKFRKFIVPLIKDFAYNLK